MIISFRIHLDDPSDGRERRFARKAEIPYPAVPRVGEYVVLPTNDPGATLEAREVSRVIYAADGLVILEIKIDGLSNDASSQVAVLQQAGYRELSSS
jgi:hypothetical protein